MKIKIPLVRRYSRRFGCGCPRAEIVMEVRTRDGDFVSMRFILDTGSDITTISVARARAFDLEFDDAPENEVDITGSTGRGRGYRDAMTARIQGMEFRWPCAFSNLPVREESPSAQLSEPRSRHSLLGRAGFQNDWEFCIDDYFLTLVYRSRFRRWWKALWRKLRGYPPINNC